MRFVASLICCWCLVMSGLPRVSAANVADFIDFSDAALPGRLYVPPQAAAGARPLIVFMHGASVIGIDNTGQINKHIDNLLAEAKSRGAYLYAPQTLIGWSSASVLDRIMTMVDRAITEHSVAGRRLYATGLSLGGGGTWNLVNRHGDRFAAAVPICAVPPSFDALATNLAEVPTWAFHAKNDQTVPYTTTREVIASILETTGESPPVYPAQPIGDFFFQSKTLDLRHTEYRIGKHGIWDRVYSTPAVYDWMFAHSLVPEPASLGLSILAGLAAAASVRRPAVRRQSLR